MKNKNNPQATKQMWCPFCQKVVTAVGRRPHKITGKFKEWRCIICDSKCK